MLAASCGELAAGARVDAQSLLADVLRKRRIFDGRVEGIAQHLQALRRQIGRRQERTAEALAGIEQAERPVLLVVAGAIEDEGRVLEQAFGATVQQDFCLAGREPLGALAGNAVEAVAAAFDLAPLHREKDVGSR